MRFEFSTYKNAQLAFYSNSHIGDLGDLSERAMQQRLKPLITITAFSLIWSSAFIAGAIALEEVGPFTLLFARFALTSLVLLPFSLVDGSLHTSDVIHYGLLLGLLNNIIYLGLSFSALCLIGPEVVIVIISCAPFVTTTVAALLGMETFSVRTLIGILLGFSGVLIISGMASFERANVWGFMQATAAMLSFAAGTVLFRRKSHELPILQTNFWQSFAGALGLLPVAVVLEGMFYVPSAPTFIAVLYLVFVVSIGGMALWLVLIRSSGAGTASSYHLLNPFFGVLLAYLFLEKQLNAADFIGAALIAVGLFSATSIRGKNHV